MPRQGVCLRPKCSFRFGVGSKSPDAALLATFNRMRLRRTGRVYAAAPSRFAADNTRSQWTGALPAAAAGLPSAHFGTMLRLERERVKSYGRHVRFLAADQGGLCRGWGVLCRSAGPPKSPIKDAVQAALAPSTGMVCFRSDGRHASHEQRRKCTAATAFNRIWPRRWSRRC